MSCLYLYLHGFASSPASHKATYFQQRFAALGIPLEVPDLNLGDFRTATVSAQLAYLQQWVGDRPFAVIGSSLGGLLAALLAASRPNAKATVLLAPAFAFDQCLVRGMGAAAIAQWQQQGEIGVYHHGERRVIPLPYSYFADAQQYSEFPPCPACRVAILHGRHDTTVPPATSIEFAARHPHVTLELLDSDHALTDILDTLWTRSRAVLGL